LGSLRKEGVGFFNYWGDFVRCVNLHSTRWYETWRNAIVWIPIRLDLPPELGKGVGWLGLAIRVHGVSQNVN
jgi:hypothetical protein